jgi:hypothetical protein
VSTKTSIELILRDGANVCMGVAIHLPPVGCCPIELVHSKKDFLVIRALGDHEFLLNSLKPIFSFHWVLGLGECVRASSQEFPNAWIEVVVVVSVVVAEPGGSAGIGLVSVALLASAGFAWPGAAPSMGCCCWPMYCWPEHCGG